MVNQLAEPRRPVVRVADISGWEAEADVVVVGSGGSGLTAALTAAECGARVVVLEKAASAGGTTCKSGGGVWVPNNPYMRSAGLPDPRPECLRYLARTSRPHLYSPDRPNLGLPAWEFELLEAFYDNGFAAFDALDRLDGLHLYPLPGYPNYYSEIAEDTAPAGRTLVPMNAAGQPADGPEMIRQLRAAIEVRGGEVRFEHVVTSAVIDADGQVVGVVASSPAGPVAIRSVRGLVFASGGFTHNPELRDNYLPGPVFGGGAAVTNEGDFVAIAESLGAAMRNMNQAWNAPLVLEQALARDPDLVPVFSIVGRSMLAVNRYGRRALNEKSLYHEACAAMTTWDGVACEYPNLLMIVIWDQANLEAFGSSEFGAGVIVDPAAGGTYVMQGETLDELAVVLRDRVEALAERTGGVRLAPDFAATLHASVRRFNELAQLGIDLDRHRGESAIERYLHKVAVSAAALGGGNLGDFVNAIDEQQKLQWTSPALEAALATGGPADPGGPAGPGDPSDPGAVGNDSMAPLSETGPYYAVILAPGTLDTKGGPKTNRHGEVLDHTGRPIPGLYAVGNCAASPTAHGYWGAGGTLGPMLTYAWLAGQHVANRVGSGD